MDVSKAKVRCQCSMVSGKSSPINVEEESVLSFSLQGDRIYLPAAVSALRSLVTGETLRCVLVLILLIEIVIICCYELVFFRDEEKFSGKSP